LVLVELAVTRMEQPEGMELHPRLVRWCLPRAAVVESEAQRRLALGVLADRAAAVAGELALEVRGVPGKVTTVEQEAPTSPVAAAVRVLLGQMVKKTSDVLATVAQEPRAQSRARQSRMQVVVVAAAKTQRSASVALGVGATAASVTLVLVQEQRKVAQTGLAVAVVGAHRTAVAPDHRVTAATASLF
jgi:hypothetical protein